MASMGTSIAFGTIAPGTSQSELISFTGVTQNSDGTATLTGVTRGLNKEYPYTESFSFKQPHQGQSIFILSDAPQVFNQYGALVNTNTWSGLNTYTVQNAQTTAGNPTLDNEYARKAYVDAVATGGVSNNKVIVAGTAGETVAVDQLVYLKVSDGRWWLADADTAATVENVILGITQGSGTAGNPVTSGVLTYGLNTFSGLTVTANTKYYASNTAGGFSSSTGTKNVSVGESQSTTTIFFNPRFDQQLTQDQINALVGTSGTPSTSNKYVTNDDTASAATASKVARRNATGDVTVPSTPTATTDAASKAYVDSKGGIISQSTTPATSSVANTTENTLYTIAIPANTLGTTGVIQVELNGTWAGSTGGRQITLRGKYGSTSACTMALLDTTSSATGSWRWTFNIFANAATNAQKGRGVYTQNTIVSTLGTSTTQFYVTDSQTLTEDSTTALNLTITSQLSSTNFPPTVTIDNYTVTVL